MQDESLSFLWDRRDILVLAQDGLREGGAGNAVNRTATL